MHCMCAWNGNKKNWSILQHMQTHRKKHNADSRTLFSPSNYFICISPGEFFFNTYCYFMLSVRKHQIVIITAINWWEKICYLLDMPNLSRAPVASSSEQKPFYDCVKLNWIDYRFHSQWGIKRMHPKRPYLTISTPFLLSSVHIYIQKYKFYL